MADHRFNEEETFLYYQRSPDGWICPSCETELNSTEESCFMCGCTKQVWFRQQEEERRAAVYVQAANVSQSSGSGAGRIIAAILIIVLLLAIFYFASNAAEIGSGITEMEGYSDAL